MQSTKLQPRGQRTCGPKYGSNRDPFAEAFFFPGLTTEDDVYNLKQRYKEMVSDMMKNQQVYVPNPARPHRLDFSPQTLAESDRALYGQSYPIPQNKGVQPSSKELPLATSNVQSIAATSTSSLNGARPAGGLYGSEKANDKNNNNNNNNNNTTASNTKRVVPTGARKELLPDLYTKVLCETDEESEFDAAVQAAGGREKLDQYYHELYNRRSLLGTDIDKSEYGTVNDSILLLPTQPRQEDAKDKTGRKSTGVSSSQKQEPRKRSRSRSQESARSHHSSNHR